MKNQIKKIHPIFKITQSSVINLPTPSSISYMWNWGSILGVILVIQLISGMLLASHYNSSIENAFSSVIHITREVNYGWNIRFIHMNGASIFFLIIYIHISRGIMFSSFKMPYTWISGVMILFILMATAFLGYVLPWGQMSFWGATVITNLVSAIPYLGKMIVEWLWGGFSVSGDTLNRFFMLHFLLPFILTFLIIIHLASLHMTGSNNPQGVNSNKDKIKFNPFFSAKDILGFMMFFTLFLSTTMLFPFSSGDPENFNMANPLNTPIHIQPEWYFLFAYAILRSIPNKLGGVIALVLSILILIILPIKNKMKMSNKFKPASKNLFWILSISFIILTWSGANPVEEPYEKISQMTSILYFSSFILYCFNQ